MPMTTINFSIQNAIFQNYATILNRYVIICDLRLVKSADQIAFLT